MSRHQRLQHNLSHPSRGAKKRKCRQRRHSRRVLRAAREGLAAIAGRRLMPP